MVVALTSTWAISAEVYQYLPGYHWFSPVFSTSKAYHHKLKEMILNIMFTLCSVKFVVAAKKLFIHFPIQYNSI